MGCNGIFFQPNDRIYYLPGQFALTHEEVWFQSGDGTRLHGWFLPAQSGAAGGPRGAIVFFHGNAANITNHLYAVRWLPKAGYAVFIFDYRGYGQSGGTPDRAGAIADGAAAIRWMGGRRDIDPERIVVYGQSLGGALAVNALAEAGAGAAGALVLESTFASYQEVARLVMNESWLLWSFQYPFAYLFFSDDQAPLDAMDRIAAVPVLVVHRQDDGTVPFAAGEALYEALPNPDKTLWAVPGEGHIVTFASPNPWRERLLGWMGEKLDGTQ